MKVVHGIPALLLLLAACQGGPGPAETETPEAPAPATAWAGFYADTLPCADCPGILTQLELRDDSTYVLREQYIERDSIPYGTIGTWTVGGNRLTLRTSGTPMLWAQDGDGLRKLDADGKPIDSALNFSIRRTARFDARPMHLTGGYVYYADSHSFTPCGASFPLPVAMDPPDVPGAGLELERTYTRQVKQAGQPLYVQVTATLRSGPAMEGDGTDEYLHIGSVDGVLDLQECR